MNPLNDPIRRRYWLGRAALAATLLPTLVGAAARRASADDTATGTQAVFDHHLGAFAQGIDAILSDYTENSVVVTPEANHRGLTQIRTFFQAFLDSTTPEFWKQFKVMSRSVEGEIAYLVWSSQPAVPMATDTLLVRDKKILVQTFTPFKV
jgi:hypothetical protein